MHLRNVEGGGGVAEPASTRDGLSSFTPNGTSTPSSVRTISLKNRLETPYELLLSWLLVLFRANDDTLHQATWGLKKDAQNLTPDIRKGTIDLSNPPFQKSDSLSDAVRAVSALDTNEGGSTFEQNNEYYFNNTIGSNDSVAKGSHLSRDVSTPKNDWTHRLRQPNVRFRLTALSVVDI